MDEKERLKLCMQELSMVTGVINKDIDYLLYLLLKDGILFTEEEEITEQTISENAVPTFSDWFDNLWGW